MSEEKQVPKGAVGIQVHHPMTRALVRGVITLDRLLRKALLKLSYSEMTPAKYEELCGIHGAARVVERLAMEMDEAIRGVPPQVLEARHEER